MRPSASRVPCWWPPPTLSVAVCWPTLPPVPYQVPPYRSIVVASSNDPYCPVRKKGGTDAQAAEFVAKLHTVK